MARDGQARIAVGHHGVLAFVRDAEAELGEDAHGGGAADARQLGHGSDDDDILLDFRDPGFLRLDLQPFPDGGLDILDGLLPRGTLGMATGQHRATDCPTFFGLNQANSIFHGRFIVRMEPGCNAIGR